MENVNECPDNGYGRNVGELMMYELCADYRPSLLFSLRIEIYVFVISHRYIG